MSAKKNDIQIAVQSHLCNRCGTCVGLSEGRIQFIHKSSSYLPHWQKKEPHIHEDEWQEWSQYCSAIHFSFPEMNVWLFGNKGHYQEYIGTYQSIAITHGLNHQTRLQGASGGVLSSLLIWMLETQKIQGAVVTRMHHQSPWLPETFIATTREEILEAAQSKYVFTAVNSILPKIRDFPGKLAYVGIPPQVQSLRLLQKQKHPWVKNIEYVFGPFYGNTLHMSSINSFMRSHGEKNINEVTKVSFRDGEWPGNMRIDLQDGKTLSLKKFHANYLIPFHITKTSLMCIDLANEFTDLSVGDAWAPHYEERGKGFGTIITRSEKGDKIFKEAVAENIITSIPISENEAIKMHSHGYDFKKRGAMIRRQFLKYLGMTVPQYDIQARQFPKKRWVMEFIIDIIFFLCSLRLTQKVIEQIPPTFHWFVFRKSS